MQVKKDDSYSIRILSFPTYWHRENQTGNQTREETDLDPARRFFDGLARVVGPPALDEGEPQDAEPAQVVDADAGRRRQADGRLRHAALDVVAAAGHVTGHGGRLRRRRRLRRGRLLLHLAVALAQVEHLPTHTEYVD